MNDQLFDYLLERLEEPAKRQVEARLQNDAAARRHLELLRQALAPLAADQELVPPPHLAAHTIARVAEYICRDLPRAPAPPQSESGSRQWWRRADALIAACLLILALGIGVPALVRLRDSGSAAALTECQNNLRLFHVALKSFEDQHKRLPAITDAPDNVAGMIVPMLQDAGVLSPEFSVRCSGNGAYQACSFTMEEIKAMSAEERAQRAANFLPSYAFTLGYRDQAGVWHAITRSDEASENAILILADNPPPSVVTGNSLNHRGRGQNVLFLDGHVQFLTLRSLAGDDIYLNRANLVAAGLEQHDIVLGASGARP